MHGLKHQMEKRSMEHFAGLDVSVNETSVCIVDDAGRIVREVVVASEPDALLAVLKSGAYHFKRIGLEAGPLSQWLCSALAEANLPVICVETRHMRAVLQAQINKADRRLAVIMHRIWIDGTEFSWTRPKPQRHDDARSNSIGENVSSHRMVA